MNNHYPRRLYLNGEVIAGDLHATNSVVVADPDAEAKARSDGYCVAYEKPDSGGNGRSSASALLQPINDGAASVTADPIADDVDDIEALRTAAAAKGIRVDRRWKEDRLRAEIEAA